MSEHKYARGWVQPCSVWRHLPDGALYVVVGVALVSTNGPDEHQAEDVVYMSVDRQALRTRRIGEFLDGRFVPVPAKTA